MSASGWKVLGLLLCCFLSSCGRESSRHEASPAGTALAVRSAPPLARSAAAPVNSAAGNAVHGKELVAKFECSRCHDGTGLEAAVTEKHCTHCHQDILAGKFKASPVKMDQWKKHVGWVRDIPSLEATGARFQPVWIERFLLEPRDLRPNLAQTMPRLKLSPAEARDIAAYLTQNRPSPTPISVSSSNLEEGRELLEAKGCGGCHRFTGVGELATTPRLEGPEEHQRAVSLAPDLRFARQRFRPEQIVRWIMDPKAIKPDTLMSPSPVSESEAQQIAGYILNAPLAPQIFRPVPARLPVLTRKVSFGEVYDRVLAKTCRHCHSDPDVALGDGGPGNTGGFGFAPRRLNLSTYSGVAAGLLDETEERVSVFSKQPDGTPLLVAALLARQAEEAGQPYADLRGMPLGLPSVPPEDIQLVDTWIAQGRPK